MTDLEDMLLEDEPIVPGELGLDCFENYKIIISTICQEVRSRRDHEAKNTLIQQQLTDIIGGE